MYYFANSNKIATFNHFFKMYYFQNKSLHYKSISHLSTHNHVSSTKDIKNVTDMINPINENWDHFKNIFFEWSYMTDFQPDSKKTVQLLSISTFEVLSRW